MNKFLYGSATSAYQVEGAYSEADKSMSNWDSYCHSEKNLNKITGDVSCDQYHHYKEDIKMLAESGQNAYRFSLSWTRILPGNGQVVSKAGVNYYKRIIRECQKYSIEPFVTLYHYDLPIELFNQGGWENRETAYSFVKYAQVCFREFGDDIKYWTTINEPNYETFCCYGRGNYPPNVQDLRRRWQAMYHMMLGSALAIKAYKEGNYCGQIGIVSDSYSIETLVNNDAYLLAKKHANIFYNLSVNDVAIKGEYPKSFIEKLQSDGYDLSYMKESDKLIFKSGVVDFLGVNAYDRVLVKPYTKGKTRLVANNSGNKDKKNETIIENWFQLDEDNTTLKNAWDCEIYPKSIYNLLMDLKKCYPKTSFVITENGLGYYDELIDGKVDDSYRIEFLKEYLKYMDLAIVDGCKVFGYFVWSTVDLYSWINGYKKRYGLVYIDYENNNKRIPKKSYYWYKNYLESKGEKNEKN